MNDRLPVLATILAAIELCLANLSYAVKITAPWFIILLIIPNLVFTLIDPGEIPAGKYTPWRFLEMAIYTVGWCSIAVLWHWRILRSASQSNATVTFDQRVWSYLMRGVLIALATIGIAMIAAIPLIVLAGINMSVGKEIFAYLTTIPILIACGILVARLGIALPAIALYRQDFGLGDAWNATSNNSLRLLLVTLLPTLPIYLFIWLVEAVSVDISEVSQYGFSPIPFTINMVMTMVDFAIALIGLSILSLTYRFFVESKEAQTVVAKD